MDSPNPSGWDSNSLTEGPPPPPPNVLPAIIPPQDIDALSHNLGLDNMDRMRLHAFVTMGSLPPTPLSPADLLTRLYALAMNLYHFANRNSNDTSATNKPSLHGLLTDISIRLDDNFQVTTEQSKNIRLIAQDIIYAPKYHQAKDLKPLVLKTLMDQQVLLRFNNIWGNAAREVVLRRVSGKICSSVRGGWKEDIIMHRLTHSLEEFTHAMNQKYKRITLSQSDVPVTGNPNEVLGTSMRNAILRHFVYLHPHFGPSGDEETDDEDDMPPHASSTSDSQGGLSRKRSRLAVKKGKVPKSESFWGVFDAWMAEKLGKLGANYNTTGWRTFIEDIHRLDKAGFVDHDASDSFGGSNITSGLSLMNGMNSGVPQTPARSSPVSGISTPTAGSAASPASSSQAQAGMLGLSLSGLLNQASATTSSAGFTPV